MSSAKFSYAGLFSSRSQDLPTRKVIHPKYDFVVAYPDPETVPLEGLMDGLKAGLAVMGRTSPTTPTRSACRSCANSWSRSSSAIAASR